MKKGNDRFRELLEEMWSLRIKKGTDYGTKADNFANLHASKDFGIEPWVASALRLNDKVNRIKSFIINQRLENESIIDNLKDIAVYALLIIILYEETIQRRSKKRSRPVAHWKR